MKKLVPGQIILQNRYEILQKLGEGRFGEVFLARDLLEPTFKLVAIKCFANTSGFLTPNNAQALAHEETLLLGALSYPGFVRIIGQESDEFYVYLIEEYLAGGNLTKAIKEFHSGFQNSGGHKTFFQTLSLKALINIFLKLSRSLDIMHGKGFFHGDIKPSNICFRDLGYEEPVLVDFGQGGFTDNALYDSKSIPNAATLSYLPPERTGFVKDLGNASSDLYSLGVSIYELITGEQPFFAESTKDTVAKILGVMPKSICEIVSDFPEQLNEIIKKLIRKNPTERYQTALGLSADLETCIGFLDNAREIEAFALGRKDRIRELNYKIPLVGRTAERTFLSKALLVSLEGKGSIYFLGAPSGTGKSRLAGEISHLARTHGFGIMAAKYSEFERNIPLSALSIALQEHLIWMETQPAEILDSWKIKVQELMGNRLSAVIERLPYFQSFFPLVKNVTQPSETAMAQSFFAYLAEFVTLLPSGGPGQFLFLDDLQWADVESLKVVSHLVAIAQAEKFGNLMCLGVYRSDEVEPTHQLAREILSQAPQKHNILLGPLSREDSDQLVRHLLDESGSHLEKLYELTFQMALGNPFYIFEYLKSVLNTGTFFLDESNGVWCFDYKKALEGSVSHGTFGLLLNRLKRQSAEGLSLIGIAAVLGSQVEVELLRLVWQKATQRQVGVTSAAESNAAIEKQNAPEQPENFGKDQVNFLLEVLSQDHLISVHNDVVIFFHDKIREAAIKLLEPKEKIFVHRDCGFLGAQEIMDCLNSGGDVSSKKIFEIAHHVINGIPEELVELSISFLFLAARRAHAIFSFLKSREYLETAGSLCSKYRNASTSLWCDIHEMLAESRVLSEELVGGIELFYQVKERSQNHSQILRIYSKIVEHELSIFEYTNSVGAARQGLDVLNAKYAKTELSAWILLIHRIPRALISTIWYNTFGKQNLTLTSEDLKLQHNLQATSQVPLYFSEPIIALSELLKTTCEIHPYANNFYRVKYWSHWGVFLPTIGFERLARRFLATANKYYTSHSHPVEKNFVQFIKAYLTDFPHGKIEDAKVTLEEVALSLENLGESFWRILSFQALIQCEFKHGNTPKMQELTRKINNVFTKVKRLDVLKNCLLKPLFWASRFEEALDLEKIMIHEIKNIEKQKVETLDLVYACIALAELHQLKGDQSSSLRYSEKAFYAVFRHFHRVSYCNLAPILYAQNLIRNEQVIKSLLPMFFAWLSILIGIVVYLPQTLFMTGEFLFTLKLKPLAKIFFNAGIFYGRKKGWVQDVAEGRLRLGELVFDSEPEYAISQAEKARFFFESQGQLPHVKSADHIIAEASLKLAKIFPGEYSTKHTIQTTAGLELRAQLETSALLELFLKLSAINEQQPLLEALLEALCSSTGSETAVLFLKEQEVLVPKSSRGVSMEFLNSDNSSILKVNKRFIDEFIEEGMTKHKVINGKQFGGNKETSGSLLLYPLKNKDDVIGFCLLSNRFLTDLFNGHALETIGSLLAQGVIALQNISLLEERESKARIDAEIEAAKAVQDNLLPTKGLEIPEISVCYHYKSASVTGGDWLGYDFDKVSHLAFFYIGDVTGHGFSSALITGVVNGAIHASEILLRDSENEKTNTPMDRLRMIAKTVNQVVHKSGSRSGLLMTMAFLCLNTETGELFYLNAGHTAILIRSKGESKIKTILNPGSRLGASPTSNFTPRCYVLQPGDTIFGHTDGLTEQESLMGNSLTLKKISKILEKNEDIMLVREQILESSKQLWEGTVLQDDYAFFLATWHGPGKNVA